MGSGCWPCGTGGSTGQPGGGWTVQVCLRRLAGLSGWNEGLEADVPLLTSEALPVGPRAGSCLFSPNTMPPPGNDSQAERYRNLRAQRLAALSALLWDEQKGAWFDYDIENGKNLEFYPSNLTPLWAGCFSDPATVDKALKYLEVREAGRSDPLETGLPSTHRAGTWQASHLPTAVCACPPCGSHSGHQGTAVS